MFREATCDGPFSFTLSQVLVKWEPRGLPLQSFIDNLEVDMESWNRKQITDMIHGNLVPNKHCLAFVRRIHEIVNKFKAEAKGLCLHCVRMEDKRAATCREH